MAFRCLNFAITPFKLLLACLYSLSWRQQGLTRNYEVGLTIEMSRKEATSDEDEPLNDTTAVLPLRSKKTERLQRKQEKKSRRKVHSDIKSFLDLPGELLLEVLRHFRASDVFGLLRLNQFSRDFVLENEQSIAASIKSRRYWVFNQCFPLPLPLAEVDAVAHGALLSTRWQERLKIHRNPYQHIKQIDAQAVCTCMSCVLAWNNLNIILDLAHWQTNLMTRQPLPIIPRGRTPEWNKELLEMHANIVEQAMSSPLTHARILEKHLATTTGTIIRFSKWRKKGENPSIQKPRLYRLSDEDAARETDEYLERSGPPSYQPIYMRDNYYSVEAFVPNRKWDKEEQRWHYYSKWPKPHLNDLMWVVARFTDTG